MSTRVTNKSYGSKIGSSFKGIIGGVIAILGAIALLWWNESNSVKELAKISEGKKNTIEISADQVLSENNGKLVHLAGLASTNDTLKDNEFGFKVNAIYFQKTVEKFQYKENKETKEKENLGGSSTITETFTYEKVWSEDIINSDNFYEQDKINPKKFEHTGTSYYANNVNIEAFKLSDALIRKISDTEEYPVNSAIYIDTTNKSRVNSGEIYFGNNPDLPEIGDERVSFSVIYPKEVSIIAEQKDKSFEPYITKNGRVIELVNSGIVSKEQMYVQEEQKNKIITWLLRVVGFFLMFGGFTAILKPLSTLGSVIPLFGQIINAGTSIIAFILAFIISVLIIAIAWIFYRPILAAILILIAIGAVILGRKFLSEKKDTTHG